MSLKILEAMSSTSDDARSVSKSPRRRKMRTTPKSKKERNRERKEKNRERKERRALLFVQAKMKLNKTKAFNCTAISQLHQVSGLRDGRKRNPHALFQSLLARNDGRSGLFAIEQLCMHLRRPSLCLSVSDRPSASQIVQWVKEEALNGAIHCQEPRNSSSEGLVKNAELLKLALDEVIEKSKKKSKFSTSETIKESEEEDLLDLQD